MLFAFQQSSTHAVALIYDPLRNKEGKFALRAYVLSENAEGLMENGDWSPASVMANGIDFGNFLEELEVVIKNSHLANVLLAQLAKSGIVKMEQRQGFQPAPTNLRMSRLDDIEKCVRLMVKDVDIMQQVVNHHRKFSHDAFRAQIARENLTKRMEMENRIREEEGDELLTSEEMKELLKDLKRAEYGSGTGLLDTFVQLKNASTRAEFVATTCAEDMAKVQLLDDSAQEEEQQA
ncbi:hypothetical protein L596_019764 [Steinernema carpocapsae]|uniref:eIF3h C-terminal domain-containing protein n=1 Tax=Steinernema carpocapsae TaxID=34508 RepID=A0A4U5MS13_STECR|nr:hypothetical protein L596_019764 [Steinernema carpocapsae]